MEKAREFQKKICFTDYYSKAFDYVDHNKLWQVLKEMGVPDHLIYLLIFLPAIKITGRNINNLRYADDTTLMAESEEEVKNFLMKVKEESPKKWSEAQPQKTKNMATVPITSWQTEGEDMEAVTDFTFLGSIITADACFLGGK